MRTTKHRQSTSRVGPTLKGGHIPNAENSAVEKFEGHSKTPQADSSGKFTPKMSLSYSLFSPLAAGLEGPGR